MCPKKGQLGFSLMTGRQRVVAIEGVQAANFEPPLQTVLQEMGPPLVEIHPALLIDQGLQELQFSFSHLDLDARSSHESPLKYFPCRSATRTLPRSQTGQLLPPSVTPLFPKSWSVRSE